jgi:hypothetical protein
MPGLNQSMLSVANENVETINLNSPNLAILPGNAVEPVPMWMQPGRVPSNAVKLRANAEARGLNVTSNEEEPVRPKFRLGFAPGAAKGGKRRAGRTHRRATRGRRATRAARIARSRQTK